VSFGAGSDRIEAWGVGLGLLKSYPLHGIGFNNFTEYHEITAHNSFVLCFSELGIVGFFLWLAIIVCSIKQLNSILALQHDNPKLKPLMRWVRMVQLSFTGFLVTSWFLSRTYVALFWILVGMSTAITDLARREMAKEAGTVTIPAVKPELRQRIAAVLQGMPPPRWAGTTAALQAACMMLIYMMVRLRWFG
jgi:O-antigen ligase